MNMVGTLRVCGSALLTAFVFFVLYAHLGHANIAMYSDLISDSTPNDYSNHTVTFTTTEDIDPGGFIRIRPAPGEFYIPTSTLGVRNVELAVETLGTFVSRSATTTANATEDGVTITPGSSGSIEVTLNATEGIPAGSDIRLRIGSHTALASTTIDTGIQNPSATGTQPIYIETSNDDSYRALVAIVDTVSVPNIDTTETVPPVRFNGAPTGLISGTTVTVEMSLRTDEFSNCRYTTASGTPYFSMSSQFSQDHSVVHSKEISVVASTTYTFYVRCIDDEGNANIDDYIIEFEVRPYPDGTPGDTGDEEGEGETEGDGGSDDSTDGEDSGDGGSPEGSGGGSTGTGGSSSGSGSSGSGGGGASSGTGSGGGGGFESTEKVYQSGDGQVIITGYAFPNSTVTILVDGGVADTVRAGGTGSFSITLDEIARGVYTFGIYATDRENVRSSTFSTTFTVTGSRGSTLSNINVMPTVKVTPDPVTPGTPLVISGYTLPNATVSIENQNDKSSASLKSYTATSDSSGKWTTTVPTDGISAGTYKARAKSKRDSDGVSTNWSGYTYYGVGQAAARPTSSDLNTDGKVNLVDFSILLFWWNTDGGASSPPADINQDGRVTLTDFSIMIFNWTG